MSDSITKYEEMVKDGKIKIINSTNTPKLTITPDKEKQLTRVIGMLSTVHQLGLEGKVVVESYNIIKNNPNISELDALEQAINLWDIK